MKTVTPASAPPPAVIDDFDQLMTAQTFTGQYTRIPPFAVTTITTVMLELTFAPIAAPAATPLAEMEASDRDGDLAARCGPFAALVARRDTATEPDASPAPVSVSAGDDASELSDEDGDDGSNIDPATKRGLRKVVGARMVSARVISSLTQTDAAKALGYKNSAQLSQWEQRKRIPPSHMLIRAAELYGVPVDYLLGVSDQTLRDPALGLRAATVRGIRGIVNGLAETLVASISNHAALVGPDAVCSRSVLAAGSELIEALRVAQRDPTFDEVKGLARVTRLAEEFEQRLHEVAKAIKRFDDLDASLRNTIASAAANDEGDSD